MSKKKKKNKGKGTRKTRKPFDKKEFLKNVQKASLKDKLQSIYHDDVSLETTMTCTCTCCKVAMPQINYSEFVQIATEVWQEFSQEEKVQIICKSVEYFFRNEYEKWGKDIFIKPCMFLDQETNLCKIYESRPLACRLFGLWPKEEYEKRVDKFEKAYKEYGLTREDLPLHKQCDKVERIDKSVELDMEMIESLYSKLDDLDKKVGDFSDTQIKGKENYRTFHDWLLLKIFGEEWLIDLSNFMKSATKEQIEDQVSAIKDAIIDMCKDQMPNIEDRL